MSYTRFSSKIQTCITNSISKSDFVVLAIGAGKEAEWLTNLIYEIPLWFNEMLCENISTYTDEHD